ncbi:MAG TPA: bifunctional salicylyl-CoA 5-hydroxylase/oxidoreductase [Alphaproteobacteria bacterium]|nr:bifunctional salicylyl-CoA 5-hydroxylase/oxidoreductase [Alphaproteobacteria bacterium]
MKIACLGGGPGGLYFAILMKKALPEAEITVYERNRADDTFGFGVVFSDATLANLGDADVESYAEIRRHLAHWDDIHVHLKGEVLRSTGHGFCGCSRKVLLNVLQERAAGLGVKLAFQHEFDGIESFADCDLVVAADGVNSTIRRKYAARFEPEIDFRPNRFIWLGTTYRFPAFTFIFKENAHGLWRVHAYQYEAGKATFIVECTEETFVNAGLDPNDEDAAIAYCEVLFKDELDGHRLLKNRSIWRNFPNVRNGRWHFDNVVLIGDGVHTAHFSIGSGTKLAMEDAIALHEAMVAHPGEVRAALASYEAKHRPEVETVQRAALVSLKWFEETERYYRTLEPLQFAFSLLTRSLRISHENLKLRDPAFVGKVDRWFAEKAGNQSGLNVAADSPPPPMFTPIKLRDMVLQNRVVVSPMCQYSAQDGLIDDWHLVHLGSRALSGAGLIITEMTDVSAEGRITPGCAGLYKPEHVAAWRRVVAFVHKHSFAKIGMQLAHAGRKGSTKVGWEGYDEPLDDGNWPIIAPSPIPYFGNSQVPREMTRADMDKVRDDFLRAAAMAEEAGFDLIELHFAHGYLLSTFLSPLTNRRHDEYGGSIENRMRYPLEVFDAVRKVWPAEKPISVRISATDWVRGGFDGEDAVTLGAHLKAHGCDIVDVSAGQVVPDQQPVYGRLFQTPFSDRVRLEAGIPTMTVGNISTFEDVNSVLAAGRADLCVLARAHLYDPYWTRHMATKQGYHIPWPKPYLTVEDYEPRFM